MRIAIHAAAYPLTRASYRLIRRRVKAWITDPDWPGRVLVEPVRSGSAVRCRVRLEWRGGGVVRSEASGGALESALESCLGALGEWLPRLAGPASAKRRLTP